MNAKEMLDRVLSHSPVTTKRFAALQIGEVARQGDIYIVRVPLTHARGKPWGSRQVAIGNSVGSRHVAVGDVEVFAGVEHAAAACFPLWAKDQVRACCGPVVVARSTWVLEHPEHPHHEFAHSEGEAACYQIGYQWNAATRARVED